MLAAQGAEHSPRQEGAQAGASQQAAKNFSEVIGQSDEDHVPSGNGLTPLLCPPLVDGDHIPSQEDCTEPEP